MLRTINEISKNALCTACGACSLECPVKAVKMVTLSSGFLRAEIDPAICIQCGRCTKVCPGIADHGIGEEFENPLIGEVMNGYVGCAADRQIRECSQSGGVVTALLKFLLEKGEIEGAWVNHFDKRSQRPAPFFAQTEEELLQCAGSYYSQTAMLSQMGEDKKTYAAVLLGCQAEALHLMKKNDRKRNFPKVTIGLICAGQNSGKMIDQLKKKAGTEDDAVQFRFRDKREGGWPGNISIRTTQKKYVLSSAERHKLKKIYEAHRCLYCIDQLNIYSDIVCGDPWGIEEKEDLNGYTVFFTRTAAGEQLVSRAIEEGVIHAGRLEPDRIVHGQTVIPRCIDEFNMAKRWYRERGLIFPYKDIAFFETEKSGRDVRVEKLFSQRLDYTRKAYDAESEEKLLRLVHQYRRAEWRQKIWNKGISLFYKWNRVFGAGTKF